MALRAVIVEDDTDANDILAMLLEQRGFRVEQAYTGREALDRARAAPPDLMLLDLMLPDIDGFEVCETLRRSRDTNLIPIVMATAMSQSEHRLHGFRVGANSYVVKPYTTDQIFKAVDEAIAWKSRLIEGRVQGEILFDVTSEIEHLIAVNDLLSSLLLLTPLDERQADHLRRALIEMGQNAIEWGNRNDVNKVIKIAYRLHPDRVTLTIRDEGPGFDYRNMPHAAAPGDPTGHLAIREVLGLREGGFGILITRGLVDELAYNKTGNEVTLIKRFPVAQFSAR
jgi:CheY-like chemotaxis protein/anti-sigma regulatory factor (Ser/Thr protein kinase)